jgi:hypothetical protein
VVLKRIWSGETLELDGRDVCREAQVKVPFFEPDAIGDLPM